MRTLTFAVAGGGPANRQQILDALNDWLGYGPEDSDGYFESKDVEYDKINLLLPLTDEQFTDGVAAVYAWSSRADLDYTGIFDEHEAATSRTVKGAKKHANDLIPADDVARVLVEQVAEHADDGDAYLLVFQEEDGSDPLAEAAAKHAFDQDVPVLNLSFALAPIPNPNAAITRKPTEAEAQATAEPGAPEPLGSVTLTDTYVARVDLAFPLTGDEQAVKEFAFATLGRLVCYHNALDTAQRAAHDAVSGGEMSPLTAQLLQTTVAFQRLLGHDGPIHLEAAQEPAAQEPATEQVEAPATTLKPAGKTRKVWLDEATGEWKPVGRGRLRKDVQVREVPVED